jgi:hypothetical protein
MKTAMIKSRLPMACQASGLAGAVAPEFGEWTTLLVNRKPLDLEDGRFAAPVVVDGNHDGIPDLVIGDDSANTVPPPQAKEKHK